MDDLGAFQEFLKVISSGGTGNMLLVGALYFLYRMDKRIQVLEVALGVVKVPRIVGTTESEKGFVKIPALVAMIVVSTILSACSATTILAGAALLQGRTALQFNAGSTKAGVTLTLPKTVIPAPTEAAPD